MNTRWPRVLALAAVVGVMTGVGVVALDRVIVGLLLHVLAEQPLAVRVVAPAVGLTLAAACLHWVARGASPSTTDEYIGNFHDRTRLLPLGPVPGRVLASVATIGFGGAQGLEGPSIYGGAAVGSLVQRRFGRYFRPEEMKILMVAGAAAGLSAVFRAPATGAIFALEVPYRNDVATRAALPALVASICSYLTFVAFLGTDPLLTVQGDPSLDATDLAGAVAVGVVAGIGARLFAAMVRGAGKIAARWGPSGPVRAGVRGPSGPLRAGVRGPDAASWLGPGRVVAAGVSLAGLALLADSVLGAPLTLGPGYDTLQWTAEAGRTVWPVALLFVLRALATGVTIAGGGAGGTFIPLVVQGALLGRLIGFGFAASRATLFTLVGISAFVGAGYRTPLAAVMFVAESTGRPGFVVPGVIATVLAQLTMGSGASVARYQQQRRPEA